MTRWVVHARAEFDAVHALVSYRGEPEGPHRHRWAVEIRVATHRLGPEGYALDFHELRRLLEDEVAPLDGADLNRHPEIGRPTPSAERVAQVLAARLAPRCAALGGRLISISIWEGPDNRVDLELDPGA